MSRPPLPPGRSEAKASRLPSALERRLDVGAFGVQAGQVDELGFLAVVEVDVGQAGAALAVGGEGDEAAVAAELGHAARRRAGC